MTVELRECDRILKYGDVGWAANFFPGRRSGAAGSGVASLILSVHYPIGARTTPDSFQCFFTIDHHSQ